MTNRPRDYAWGSRTLLAALEGRPAADAPEAEQWFGDHPGCPSMVPERGMTLDALRTAEGRTPLPYLLKLLAAAAPLSIQVHPTREQAAEGFAREGGAGPNYTDANHKPEILVALSEHFEALCGIRPAAQTSRLLGELGAPGEALAALLSREGTAGVMGRLLAGGESALVDELVQALPGAAEGDFAAAIGCYRRLSLASPGDPGVVVAMLMNHVVLRRGEAIFLAAGHLHAYVAGLGVELMAASDNVLRGGMTPKRVDVDELLRVLDATPLADPRVAAVPFAPGLWEYPVPVTDFRLLRLLPRGAAVRHSLTGPTIVVVTEGQVVLCDDGGDRRALAAGEAVYLGEGTQWVEASGEGEAFLAEPGVEPGTPEAATDTPSRG